MKRRSVLLALGSTSVAAAVGSNAFTETEADREIDVAVARDADAYLSLRNVDTDDAGGTDEGGTNDDGNAVGLVFDRNEPFEPPVSLQVENQTTVSLKVEIGISPGDAVLRDDSGGSDTAPLEFDLRVGNSETIEIDLDGFGSVDAELDITAEEQGEESQVRIEALRTVSLQRGIEGVRFKGRGNVEIKSSYEGKIDVRLMYLPSNGSSGKNGGDNKNSSNGRGNNKSNNNGGHDNQNKTLDDAEIRPPNKNASVHTSNKIKPRTVPNTSPSGRIVAIYFPELDEVYVHPGIDYPSSDDPEISNSGAGDGHPVTGGDIYDKFT